MRKADFALLSLFWRNLGVKFHVCVKKRFKLHMVSIKFDCSNYISIIVLVTFFIYHE